MAIDTNAIKEHIRGILIALGDDPDREGLKDTPDRVARMYNEVFEGMNYTNEEIAQMFGKTFEDEMDFISDSKDVVVVKAIVGMTIIIVGTVAVRLVAVVMVQRYF